MSYDHLMRPDNAAQHLSGSLRAGTLTLFIGAGVSADMGLPNWHELVRRLLIKAKIKPDAISPTSSAAELQVVADRARRELGDRYLATVKESLYKDIKLPNQIPMSALLVSMGALMTGSRRGTVQRVVTFNFDCLLEWYVGLCGMVTRVIVEPPELEGSEDVRLYHPHGFLAHSPVRVKDSPSILLGLQSVNKRLGTDGDPWFELLRHQFRTSTCLFVGMSMDSFRDRAIGPLLTTVGEEVASSRPLAFWILADEACEPVSVDADLVASDNAEMLEAGVVPVRFGDYSSVPDFLLSICQKAGKAWCCNQLWDNHHLHWMPVMSIVMD